MQVSVETTQGLERRATIVVPAEKIDNEVKKQVQQEARRARIDGFRPGKVPVSVIEKRFGQAIRQDVAMQAMQQQYIEAMIQEKLNPAGAPKFEPKTMEKGKDLEFVAIFEVYPEVELKDLEKVEVEKPVAEVTEGDVDNMLETLRKQHAGWKEVKRAAKDSDRVVIDFAGSIDGEAFDGGKASDFALEMGQGRMIPGFEEGIAGMKAGEEKTIEVTFPEEYHAENLKGKKAEFAITLKKVEEQELPELTAEFVEQFGITEGGVDALRAEVKKNMARELKGAVNNKVKQQVIKGLLAANTDVPVPSALKEQEVNALRQQALQRFGNNAKNMPELPAELFEEQAKERAQVGILLGEVIRGNELKVDDAKVKDLIETTASAYEDPQEVIEYYNSNQELMQQVRNMALEEQAIELILEKAKVTEKPMSFDDVMNPPQQ
ncbi:trigger factor [Aliidiomarina maris]|uniref:Trigger factor n=1 Tax=Aliidiomarina maris TaxID=531312 RepID=A0A327WYG9_9GAMM|nr:trigger factor [Aliidiomarina maris]MBA3988318.1 trigger factor [Idiomarina sp.]RAJ96878.1 trigger factor [Aliidiomarina maris]RUO24183.1 trigger factor [Aliidiomarina maris]